MGLRHFFKVLKKGFKAFGAKGAVETAEDLSKKGSEKAAPKVDQGE